MPVFNYVGTAAFAEMIAAQRYTPGGRNELHTIFDRHFAEFCEQYDEKYAATYGRYRLQRIQQIGERFTTCGDYLQGVARIRCTNPECGHDSFRTFPGLQSMTALFRRRVIKLLVGREFLAELTQHIPPKRLQLIRRYGLYASRTKGRWEDLPWVAERAPQGWKACHQHPADEEDFGYKPLSESEEEIDINARKRAWARLLAKVYEVDPLVCPTCGAEMKVIAIIEDPDELGRILRHLIKIGRSPPGFDPDRLN